MRMLSPPENSTYVCNHHEFFDTLSTNVYEYQKYGKFCIVGDFNARCGETQYYIEGVDEVEPKEIFDYNRNSYGDTFLDFLVNINCCMLNGRQGSSNEFTYIEPRRGHSVVDYCLVPHKQLNESNDFVIYRATVLMQNIDITTVSNPEKSVSDQSLLTWIVKFDEAVGIVREKHHQTIRYDTRKVPSDFLNGSENTIAVSEVIKCLDENTENQNEIDGTFTEFCRIIDNEKELKLRKIIVKDSNNNKKRRVKKQWWTDGLTDLWNICCTAKKKDWLKASIHDNRLKKEIYVRHRKHFDREVQKRKRNYRQEKEQELTELQCKNQKEFWKEIGKIGIGNNRKK